MAAIYYRNGRLIFWNIRKRLVVELRLPLFIWRTNGRKQVDPGMAPKVAGKEVRVAKFGIPILSYSGKEILPGRIEREAT